MKKSNNDTNAKLAEKKGKKKRWTRDDTELALLSLPTTIWYCIFAYLPMFGIIIAFKNYKVNAGHGFIYSLMTSAWVGFDNFKYFVTSSTFSLLLRNTILYNLAFICVSAFVSVSTALILSNMRNKRGSKVYQTMMFLPYFMSWVVISYFVYALLATDKGYFNGILTALGLDKVMWYQSPQYWPIFFVVINTWKGMGYGMVLYLATITGIDQSMYEAALVDGASKWQQTTYITLPSIRPTFIMLLILDCGKIFNSDFGLFYQVTKGVPNSLYNVASTFDTWIYTALKSSSPIGRTAAATFFQSICSCATILFANWVVKKLDSDNAII